MARSKSLPASADAENRCCFFELFDEYLRNHGTDATQIIKIELDQRRYYKYRNPITLCEYVEQLVLGQQDKKLYLFIDEV